MADQTQFATPDAFADKIKSKYPEYKDIPNVDLSKKVLAKYPEYWDHVDAAAFAKNGIARDGQTAQPQHNSQQPPHDEMRAYNPGWWERIKNVWHGGDAAETFREAKKYGGFGGVATTANTP